MVIKAFPTVETASPEGLLAIGGDLEVPSLKLAYQSGVFPWPSGDLPLLWFAPPRRAVLKFKELKVPKRFQRDLKKKEFQFKVDKNFPAVIQACAEGVTRNSQETWITPEMVHGYIKLHQAGLAHSFECYNQSDQLVGGLYGVSLGNMFSGESMFFWESGASKAALIFACEYLKKRGGKWLDVQMVSPLLEGFGAREIPRKEFMRLLKEALEKTPIFTPIRSIDS